jgi:hypothetical protein
MNNITQALPQSRLLMHQPQELQKTNTNNPQAFSLQTLMNLAKANAESQSKSEPTIQTELEKFLYMQCLNLHSKIQQLTSIINQLPVQVMTQPVKIQKKEENVEPCFNNNNNSSSTNNLNTTNFNSSHLATFPSLNNTNQRDLLAWEREMSLRMNNNNINNNNNTLNNNNQAGILGGAGGAPPQGASMLRNLMAEFANFKNMMETGLTLPKEEKFEEF